MNNLEGLKICLNQMKVVPGKPDINALYMIEEIKAAADRGIDIIIFPEMAVPGYFIGDKLENRWFVNDIVHWNQQICKASQNITVIFGTVIKHPDKKGEDGNDRLSNVAMVAANGSYIGYTIKTLQPNYRYFNDDKHLYSARKYVAEKGVTIEDDLRTFEVPVKDRLVIIGVILCEDMWHKDYPVNPTKILVDKGAQVVFNLSASPWGWQKNRKRHQVVKSLLQESPVPFVYINNSGAQNTGKNILVFDGSSSVYNPSGDLVYQVEPYQYGGFDYQFADHTPALVYAEEDDTAQLFKALVCAIEAQIELLPQNLRKVVVGLSGGIDSAVTAALFTHVLGPEHVFTINMPSQYNSQTTKDFAKQIANNLEVSYTVRPIEGIVAAICEQVSLATPGSVAYQNIQARARMEILAAAAQAEVGGVFSCNGNKAEFAFGYGTMYADIAGFLAVLGDMVKREVRQIAEYLNKEVFGKEVIPQACIDQKPSAELDDNQVDPFDYGGANERGYHDELIRAFTEFSADPEYILELYKEGLLEQRFGLENGSLRDLFSSDFEFVIDLEKHWKLFHASYHKRVQSPPIVVVSKRAFGRDLEESIMGVHFTTRYYQLKHSLLYNSIAIFGGSFNPTGLHHNNIAEALLGHFEKVIILPGGGRPDKSSSGEISDKHREAMLRLSVRGISFLSIDLFDIDNDEFTPTAHIDQIYKEQFPGAEIYHVVGPDLVAGGRFGKSEIQTKWFRGEEVWNNLSFAVINHSSDPVDQRDLPPNHKLINLDGFEGRSTLIRERLKSGQSITGLVTKDVEEYIFKHNLYL